ncbi:gpi ethanolamine phosphate transferase 1 [Echinococcus multilocularis]|uniref:GPI ethanolamine phosphate transferase 1 n=1 Tax=Echinococcus multilocularis TaxID=6211 RepID=A0A068Y0W8_ECHMU|nr:gpi ethanolamine phosphate transferase 1 [Echinococcus multilocularis]
MVSSTLRTLLSVVLYILLFYSIFDVYYTSPLVHGMDYKRPSRPSLVGTVVFIVADGLRYDKLFTLEMENTPTLRGIILNEGSWGYSHTRVPTESRPGHVALFAGFYEDVASITKGWQANAVEFDSIFNRSYQAFAWGGPDVVPMFQPLHRVGDARVKIESYPHVMLDFTAENITQVDDWVVDRFSDFMQTHSHLLLKTNSSESPEDGFRKGNFIFLHLSAADQMGHTKKPDSEAYTAMIHNLDTNIARILAIFKEHPNIAQETAFIFTSDHGMTDWGSHGAGSAHETITPLIVWGKHIPRPRSANWPSHLLPFTRNLGRHDIHQADLCPLIACLLGIAIPANSVGELPLDLLDVDSSVKVGLIRENALHILKQLHIKYEEQKAGHYHFLFREFSKFTQKQIDNMLESAALQATNHDYVAAIETYRRIIRLSLEGLDYYHKYGRFFMGICIGLSYAVWSLLLFVDTFCHSDPKPRGNEHKRTKPDSWVLALSLFISIVILGFLSNAHHQSLLRTFYQILPLILGLILLWTPRYRQGLSHLFCRTHSFKAVGEKKQSGSKYGLMLALLVILMEFGLWGFVHRSLLAFGAIFLGTWPYLDSTFIKLRNRPKLQRIWCCACCVLAIFPSLPLVGSFTSPTLVLFSNICTSMLAFVLLRICRRSEHVLPWYREPNYLLIFESLVSGLLVFLVRILVSWSVSIPILVHIICWILLIASPLLALFNKNFVVCERLVGLTLAFFIPFSLMNVFYEGLFFLTLATVLFTWIWLESDLEFHEFYSLKLTTESQGKPPNTGGLFHVDLASLRRPLFYVFFVIYSFFGTGNIASINTFDPVSVYCFMTVLNPAAMGALLIFKILCPIVLVGIAYSLIGRVKESLGSATASSPVHGALHPETTFLMIIANFLAVHFFVMLKDEGSWLDIGESISHYVIAMSIGLASVVLSHLGSWMLVPTWVKTHSDRMKFL